MTAIAVEQPISILFAPDDEIGYGAFATAFGFPMAVILPMVAILSVTSEWSQRSGLTTFTLVPRRGRVIAAKAVAAVAVGVVSILLAFAIGAVGNVVGSALAGTDLVWDVSVVQALYIVLANVLGLLVGFMLGVLIRLFDGGPSGDQWAQLATSGAMWLALPLTIGLVLTSPSGRRGIASVRGQPDDGPTPLVSEGPR